MLSFSQEIDRSCNLDEVLRRIDHMPLAELALVRRKVEALLAEAEPDFESFNPIILTLQHVLRRQQEFARQGRAR